MTRTQSQVGKSNVRRGKTHERRVAKLLTEWSGTEFRRRRVEGRDRSTIARESTSDVIAVDRVFKFSVEAKCGKKFSFDALMASPKTAIFTSWWFQAVYDAELLSNFLNQPIAPMLFFKPSPNFDWVAIPYYSLESLKFQNISDEFRAISEQSKDTNDLLRLAHLSCIVYHYRTELFEGDISHGPNKKIVERQLPTVIICRWKQFAATIDPVSCFYGSVPVSCS